MVIKVTIRLKIKNIQKILKMILTFLISQHTISIKSKKIIKKVGVLSMDKKLGFNNGDRGIDEVAYTISNSREVEYSNPFESNMNYFGCCSNISYEKDDEDNYEVF